MPPPPPPNSNHILWLRQDLLLLNAIVRSVSATLVQFISTSATSHAALTTLEKTFVSPSHRRIMTHRQNLASLNWTITDYMQDVKHNINSLALMNVPIDFDELSICVLNGLGLAYSHISHALQARDTPIAFKELFEHLLSYETQMKILVPSAPLASTPTSALFTSTSPLSHRRSNNRGGQTHNRSQQSWPLPTT